MFFPFKGQTREVYAARQRSTGWGSNLSLEAIAATSPAFKGEKIFGINYSRSQDGYVITEYPSRTSTSIGTSVRDISELQNFDGAVLKNINESHWVACPKNATEGGGGLKRSLDSTSSSGASVGEMTTLSFKYVQEAARHILNKHGSRSPRDPEMTMIEAPPCGKGRAASPARYIFLVSLEDASGRWLGKAFDGYRAVYKQMTLMQCDTKASGDFPKGLNVVIIGGLAIIPGIELDIHTNKFIAVDEAVSTARMRRLTQVPDVDHSTPLIFVLVEGQLAVMPERKPLRLIIDHFDAEQVADLESLAVEHMGQWLAASRRALPIADLNSEKWNVTFLHSLALSQNTDGSSLLFKEIQAIRASKSPRNQRGEGLDTNAIVPMGKRQLKHVVTFAEEQAAAEETAQRAVAAKRKKSKKQKSSSKATPVVRPSQRCSSLALLPHLCLYLSLRRHQGQHRRHRHYQRKT